MSSPPRKRRIRNAIALGLTCAALLCGATTQNARAEWVLDGPPEVTGNEEYHSGAGPGIAAEDYTGPLSVYIRPDMVGLDSPMTEWRPEGVKSSGKVDGQVRVVFRWESEDEEPPEYITFKITGFSTAVASRNFVDTVLPHNAAGEKAETAVMGLTSTPYIDVHGTQSNIFKEQYKTVAVDENGKVTSPWVDIKCSVEIGGGRYTTVTMYGGATENIPLLGELFMHWAIGFENPVEKYVLISRGGSPAPKKEDDPTLNKDIDTWVESDGTVHGHTTYSFNYTVTLPPTPET